MVSGGGASPTGAAASKRTSAPSLERSRLSSTKSPSTPANDNHQARAGASRRAREATPRLRASPRDFRPKRRPPEPPLQKPAFVEMIGDGNQRVGVQRQVREPVLRRRSTRVLRPRCPHELGAARGALQARIPRATTRAAPLAKSNCSGLGGAAARAPGHARDRAGTHLRVGCGRVRRAGCLGGAPRGQRRKVVQRAVLRSHQPRARRTKRGERMRMTNRQT